MRQFKGLFHRAVTVAMLAVACVSLTGCVAMYVDTAMPDLTSAERTRVASPQPVQLIFEFQTKGTRNNAATKQLKAMVTKTVQDSGMFTTVSETPAANGAVLSIKINNVPVTDDAFAKGFATGFTFGLVGTAVTDGYICTMEYLTPAPPRTLTNQGRHALHSTIGAKSAPPNGVKAVTPLAAVETMTRQLVSRVLNDLGKNPGFPQ